MAYCSIDDILMMMPTAELIELTAESGEEADAAVVAEACDKAAAEIDAYLRVRYVLPLPSSPALVKSLAVDLAIYHLYARRSVMPPVRRQNYEAAVGFLKAVASGQAELAGGAGKASGSEVTAATRLFSRNSLGDW
jgi:phage gp36-like protein